MPQARRARPSPPVRIRGSRLGDLDALSDLENQVFETDRMSRRSLRRLLTSPSAAVLQAESGGALAGVVVVLFRANSPIARLYSIAVAPAFTGRGIGAALIVAAEKASKSRKCRFLRLEVHQKNRGAIKLYHQAGYSQFGRHHQYYEDKGHALRFQKQIAR
jgi:ribosomal protein S18 acetylase RimI-like enzyme